MQPPFSQLMQGQLFFRLLTRPAAKRSADGHFWWDGAEWRPAVSQDRLWRWNGQSWEPARPVAPAGRGGAGAAIGITIAIFFGVIVLVSSHPRRAKGQLWEIECARAEGKSIRGTATSDVYSLDGLSEALDRAAKECSG